MWLAALVLVGCTERRPPAAAADPAEVARAARLVALVQDIAEEYSEGTEASPEVARRVADLVPDGMVLAAALSRVPGLAPRLDRVAGAIRALDPPVEVQEACQGVIDDILRAEPVPRAPPGPVDLEEGQRVYLWACAGCHGALGRPDPAVALGMDAPPPDLLEAGVVNGLSPYRVYNAVSYGVRSTSMPEFPTLTEDERWQVAFFTMTLRQPACAGTAAAVVDLAELASADDNTLVARYGETALACLREGSARAVR